MTDYRDKKKGDELVIEINIHYIEEVKQKCISQNYPLIEEYDFKRDRLSPDLKLDLKSST